MNGREANPHRSLFNLLLGIHSSHFTVDLFSLNESKEHITQTLANRERLQDCEIAEWLIKNPQPDLESEIEKHSHGSYYRSCLLPFFAWTAINNRADLSGEPCFINLYNTFHEVAGDAFQIAVLFSSVEYVKQLCFITNIQAVRRGMIIACVNGDLNSLKAIVESLHVPLPIFLQKSIEEDSYTQHPLFWAIRFDLNSVELVKYFLECGVTDFKNPEMPTLLHAALRFENWKLAIFLLKDCKANIQVKDSEGRTPLNYIENIVDTNIKNQILSAYRDSNPAPLLPQLSFLANRKKTNILPEENKIWCRLI